MEAGPGRNIFSDFICPQEENTTPSNTDWVRLKKNDKEKWFQISSLSSNPHFSPKVHVERLSEKETKQYMYIRPKMVKEKVKLLVSPASSNEDCVENKPIGNSGPVKHRLKHKLDFPHNEPHCKVLKTSQMNSPTKLIVTAGKGLNELISKVAQRVPVDMTDAVTQGKADSEAEEEDDDESDDSDDDSEYDSDEEEGEGDGSEDISDGPEDEEDEIVPESVDEATTLEAEYEEAQMECISSDSDVLVVEDIKAEELDAPTPSTSKSKSPVRASSPLGFPDTELITKQKKKDKTTAAFFSDELDKYLEGNKSVNQEMAEKIVPSPQSSVGKPDLDVVDQITILSFQTRQGVHSHIATHEANSLETSEERRGPSHKLEDRELAKMRAKYLRAVTGEPFLHGLHMQSHHSSKDSYQWRQRKKSSPQQRTLAKSLKLVAEQDDQPTKGKIYGWRNDGRFASKRNVTNAMTKDEPAPKMRQSSGSSELHSYLVAEASSLPALPRTPHVYVGRTQSQQLQPVTVTNAMAQHALGALLATPADMGEYLQQKERWCGKQECRRLCICHTILPAEEPVCDVPLPQATEEKCSKDSCRLGCVCCSFAYKRREEHCGEVACIFGCVCQSTSMNRADRSARRVLNPRYGNAVLDMDDVLFEQMVETYEAREVQDELSETRSVASSLTSTEDRTFAVIDTARSNAYAPRGLSSEQPSAATGETSTGRRRKRRKSPAINPAGPRPLKPLKFSATSGSSKSTVKRGMPMVTNANYETVSELWSSIGGGSAGLPLEEADEDMLLTLMPMSKKNKQVVSVKGKKGKVEKKVVHRLHSSHVEKVLTTHTDALDGDIRKLLEDTSHLDSHQHSARTHIYVPIKRTLRCQCVYKPPPPPPPKPSPPKPVPVPSTGHKFKVQMVLVQKKRPADAKPQPKSKGIPHLLEIMSNCDWNVFRSDILARISAIAGEGTPYPKSCSFAIHRLLVSIIPPATTPTKIPIHLQSVLHTKEMFPIRVQIVPVPAAPTLRAGSPAVSSSATPSAASPPPPAAGMSGLNNLHVSIKDEPMQMTKPRSGTHKNMVLQGGTMQAGTEESPIKIEEDDEEQGESLKDVQRDSPKKGQGESPKEGPGESPKERVQVIRLKDGRQMVLRGSAGSKIGPHTITALKALASSSSLPGSKLILGPGDKLVPQPEPIRITGVPNSMALSSASNLVSAVKVVPSGNPLLPGKYLVPISSANGKPVLVPVQTGNKLVLPVLPAPITHRLPDNQQKEQADVVIKEEKDPEPKKVNITEPIEIDDDDDDDEDAPVAPVVIQPDEPKSPEPEAGESEAQEQQDSAEASHNSSLSESASPATSATAITSSSILSVPSTTSLPSGQVVTVLPSLSLPMLRTVLSSQHQAVTFQAMPSATSILKPITSVAPDVNVTPSPSARPLMAAKARLDSILKAQAKKFQPPRPPPPSPPPPPAPAVPPGPPMTVLALLKARKAGINLPAPVSSCSSASTPVASPQQSPAKRRSRKDVLITRNTAAPSPGTAAPLPSPVVPKQEMDIKEEEEEIDIETVPVQVINIEDSDEDDDPVEILRVDYKKAEASMDSSGCNIHAVGLLHGLKSKKRKRQPEPCQIARDETMEFQEEVLMVEGVKDEEDADEFFGSRDRETHMCRERARRCDLSFKFEALRKKVLPHNTKAPKVLVLHQAEADCKRLAKEQKILEKLRKQEVEKRARLVQKLLYLKNCLEAQTAEHCVTDETTGSKKIIDDVVAMAEDDDFEENEEVQRVKQEPEDDEDEEDDVEVETNRYIPHLKTMKKRGGIRAHSGRKLGHKKRFALMKQLREEQRSGPEQDEETIEQLKQQLEKLVTSSSVYVDVDTDMGDPGMFLPDVSQPTPEDSNDYDDDNDDDNDDDTGFEIKQELSQEDRDYAMLNDDDLLGALNSDLGTSLPPLECIDTIS